jgi:hypothetical protein
LQKNVFIIKIYFFIININNVLFIGYINCTANPWRACPGSGAAGACERLYHKEINNNISLVGMNLDTSM